MTHRTPQEIVAAVAARFGFEVYELKSVHRSKTLGLARKVAMVLLREQGLSYPEIGRALGNRDHTTVIFGVRKATGNPAIAAHVEHVKVNLEGKAA